MAPANKRATSSDRLHGKIRHAPFCCLFEFPVNRPCRGSGRCRFEQRRRRERAQAGVERRLDRRRHQARGRAESQLTQRFLPIVKKATDRVGLAQQYNSLAGQGAALGLVREDQATIERYVTQKALDGLYYMIGEQEKAFRSNPLGASSDIVKRVFGAIR
jgi:hypothetical protein